MHKIFGLEASKIGRKQAERALSKHREHLEELVRERTLELERANEQLRRELSECKRVEEALEKRNRELSALNTVAQSVSRSLKPDELLRAALESILEVMDLPGGAIYQVDQQSREMVPVIHKGMGEDTRNALAKIVPGAGAGSREAETGEVAVLAHPLANERMATGLRRVIEQEKVQSLVSVPLKSKDKTLAVLNIISRSPRDFSAEDIQLLKAIAGQVGIALENAQLFERMSKLSMTDELTGLYNRRHLYEVLEVEIHRTQRYGGSFSLVMLDLDGFKEYNDRFGHANGDAVLKSLAEMLKLALRKTDMAFRYGGDEFAIIVMTTDAGRAKKMVDRIRSKWLQRPKTEYPVPESHLGFSVGIAQFPENAETADDLISRADTALYHSKRQGGYRITLVSELEASSTDIL